MNIFIHTWICLIPPRKFDFNFVCFCIFPTLILNSAFIVCILWQTKLRNLRTRFFQFSNQAFSKIILKPQQKQECSQSHGLKNAKEGCIFRWEKKKGLFSKVVKTGQRKTSRSIFNPSIRTHLLKFFLCGLKIVTRVLEFFGM